MVQITMSRVLGAGSLLAGALALSGCATEDYVNQQIAPVQTQVTTLQGQVTTLQGQVNDHSAHLTKLDGEVAAAQGRADEAYKLAQGKFNYEVVSTDSSILFDTGKWNLTKDDTDKLTALAQKLKDENKNVYLEIQGHADSVGSEKSNRDLGLKRAVAVARFLHDTGGVAGNRLSIISYGEDKPVAPAMKNGNPLNRCVTIVILQ